MVSKEKFVSTIEAIQGQLLLDKSNSEAIAAMFGFNESEGLYDNHSLIKQLILLLQDSFPKDENGFCEIEHYCFGLNFGKALEEGGEYESPEQLYDRLCSLKKEWVDAKKIKAYDFYLIDEKTIWNPDSTSNFSKEISYVPPSRL